MPLGGVVNETLGHWMPDVSQCDYIPPGGTYADRVNYPNPSPNPYPYP